MHEVDKTSMNGCAYDCCNGPIFVKEHNVNQNCSERAEAYFQCKEFVQEYDTVELQVDAMYCYQQHVANIMPFIFRDATDAYTGKYENLDPAFCSKVINTTTLSTIDELLMSAAIFNHLNKFEDNAKHDRSQNILTSCFWPDVPPHNFNRKYIRKAQDSKRNVLNMRLRYISEDIEAIFASTIIFLLLPVLSTLAVDFRFNFYLHVKKN